ncbi:MAG: J domain-containing protein [Clostridiales bacterium]|nr:J domain-containing protein [Clostridiales bacterium]
MKDPYKVLGVEREADPELIKARYKELHDLYGEQRFRSGAEGNEGARKLQELEEAWALISSDLSRDTVTNNGPANFGIVDELIRQSKYDEAQDMLDSIKERNGEWHYMQAIIFYKREWLTDAKTQLEMALREEPDNAKYRSSLEKLTLTMSGPQQRQAQQNDAPQPTYNDYGGQPQDMSNCLSSCCLAYCLTDCLCNLIRCC